MVKPVDQQASTKVLCRARDSDSGHERNSSSSSNNWDEDDENVDNISECFVDAEDDFRSADELEQGEKDEFNSPHGQLEVDHDTREIIKEKAKADLKHRLEETRKILRMALNNEFVKALEICGKTAHEDLYASLANATLSFLRAALTLERGDLQEALASINQSFEVSSNWRRKTSTASMVMRFLYRPNYNHYTDNEIHAELVNAESLLLLALISFLSDQSIICLVKGAFRIRTCYQRYKECLYMMETRRNWASEEAKQHFESGVRMGYGIFNLLMSYLPRRVLRFLEYVGFSGNRSVGVEQLDKSVELDDGLRSVFSALVILTYHTYIENLFGLGSYDSAKVQQLNGAFLESYPNSAFFLLFRGRYHQMGSNLSEAIYNFERCIAAQDDWKQFHSICHWEIMWCYAVQLDWVQAAKYSDLLRRSCKWSAASYTYQYACFLFAKLVEEERSGQCSIESEDYKKRLNEIVEIMKTVPSLRTRYAGKTLPAEKFAITRTERFLKQNNRLTLPALEFLYVWNIFATLRDSPEQVQKIMARIDSEMDYIYQMILSEETLSQTTQIDESSSSSSDLESSDEHNSDKSEGIESDGQAEQKINNWNDDLSLMFLLKGVCLRLLNRLDEAEEYFLKVIANESNIKFDTFLVPHSAMELAILKLKQKRYRESKQYIKMTRNNYTGYLLETMVHFRLHAASRVIRIEQQDSLVSDSSESTNSNQMDNVSALAIETK